MFSKKKIFLFTIVSSILILSLFSCVNHSNFEPGIVAIYDPDIIIITNPSNDEIFDYPDITLDGTIVNFNGTETTLFLNGIPRKMYVDNVGFEYHPVLDSGTNTLRVQAEINDGLFYNEVSVFYDATPTALWIEFTWYNDNADTDADMDLYIYEPDGTVVWYSDDIGNGELVQDEYGYGPETYILYADNMISGEYAIRVHAYDAYEVYSGSTPVTCKVVAKKFGEIVINKEFTVDDFNWENYDPSATGMDWYDVGTIELP